MRPLFKSFLMFLSFVLFVAGFLTAAEDKTKKPDGKALYKEYCRQCHSPSSPHGEYSPLSMIQDQWDTFFKKKFEPSHKDVTDPHHEGKKVLEILSPDQIKVIHKFCVDHAADSEQPQTCG